MICRSITVVATGRRSCGVGILVAVTMVSGMLAVCAQAGARGARANNTRIRCFIRHSSEHRHQRTPKPCGPGAFPTLFADGDARACPHSLGPLHRCTPPDTRETTMHRPVSWLATWRFLSICPPSRMCMQWHSGQIWSPTVAGAAADKRWVSPSRAFPFQPFRATEAWGKVNQRDRNCPAELTSDDIAKRLNAKPDNGEQYRGCENIGKDCRHNADAYHLAVILHQA